MKKVLLVLVIVIAILLIAFPPHKISNGGLAPQATETCKGLYIRTYNHENLPDGGNGGLCFGKVQKSKQHKKVVTVNLVSIDSGKQVYSGYLQGTLNFKNIYTEDTYKLFVCIQPRRSDIHIALPQETLADTYTIGSMYSLDLDEAKNTSTSAELYGCYTRGLTPTLINQR